MQVLVLIRKRLYFQYKFIHRGNGPANNEEYGRDFCPTLQCTIACLVEKACTDYGKKTQQRVLRRGEENGDIMGISKQRKYAGNWKAKYK
jgi:hypothetical protein